MANPEQVDRNTVPTDKLEQKIANASPAVNRIDRRQFILKTGGWVSAGLIFFGLAAQGVIGRIRSEAEEQEKADEYPRLPQDQVEAAREEVHNFMEASVKLAREGRLEEIPLAANSGSLRGSYETLDTDEKRRKLDDEVWNLDDKILLVLSGINIPSGVYCLRRGFFAARKELDGQKLKKKH